MRWMFRIALMTMGTVAAFGVRRPALAFKAAALPPHSENAIAIPVLDVQREALRPTFDQARAGHVHHALDILAPRGTPVLASVDGTIRKLYTSRAGGISIYQFDADETLVYYYAHLESYADGLREGMSVRRGDVIGFVGTTGNAPAGTPHLHFAIARLTASKRWWDGEPMDPYPMLMERGVTLTTPASGPQRLASGSD